GGERSARTGDRALRTGETAEYLDEESDEEESYGYLDVSRRAGNDPTLFLAVNILSTPSGWIGDDGGDERACNNWEFSHL
ncbi:hypothetical protein Tco_0259468, partial [Tanacetum coccineum]